MKDELVRRNCLDPTQLPCPLCGLEPESINHMFASCSMTRLLWTKCFKWWDIPFVLPNTIANISHCFTYGILKVIHNNLWFFIFLTITWSIWFVRNSICFKGSNWDCDQLLQFIQRRTFLWIKASLPNSSIHLSHWISHPQIFAQSIFKAL